MVEVGEWIFIGEDGSCGFKQYRAYILKTEIREKYIHVTDLKRGRVFFIPYDGVKSFSKNWRLSSDE